MWNAYKIFAHDEKSLRIIMNSENHVPMLFQGYLFRETAGYRKL